MEKPFKDKVAIITGSGRGIGASSARLFARDGARVVLASRTSSELNQLRLQIEAESGVGSVLSVPTDVSLEVDVKNLFQKTIDTFGDVDILINNAGKVMVKEIVEMQAADWDQILSINLRGMFLCCREAFRLMKKGGSIVNISSMAGLRGVEKFRGMSAYSASKYGVIGLTEVLAVEGRSRGIRVNCLAPGSVDTHLFREAAPQFRTQTLPEDMARLVRMLADETQSGILTGTVLEAFSRSEPKEN